MFIFFMIFFLCQWILDQHSKHESMVMISIESSLTADKVNMLTPSHRDGGTAFCRYLMVVKQKEIAVHQYGMSMAFSSFYFLTGYSGKTMIVADLTCQLSAA
jgi:hypothetical protein